MRRNPKARNVPVNSYSPDIVNLRILHIVDSLSPEAGGPPEAVRMLVKSYLRMGITVEVVCLDMPDAIYLRNFPCTVHALGQTYLGRFAFSPRLWTWLRANANRYNGIVMNGIWTFPGLCLYWAARRTRQRYGIFTHGALDPWFNRQYPLKHLKKILYWPIQYSVLRNAAAVFFTTETERDLAKTSFWPNTWSSVVVEYGINDPDAGRADAERQVEAFYGRYPQLRGRRFLLFLARIHEKKGCDLLLEAFARLKGIAEDCDLVMAGPDQVGLRGKLESRASELGIASRVHWTGMLGGDLKWGALRCCEAFVLPSHQENFGISVVEALALGRPVLISDQVNIWPQIVEDRVGLVDEDTLEGTVNLLRRWFELTIGEREEMADRARASFLARFNMDRAASAINAFFAHGAAELKNVSV
jgi:glycosyltransferase involved in cell wall biosynthesis